MLQLQLSRFIKARVWIAGLPLIDVGGGKLSKRIFHSGVTSIHEVRRVAIELYVPSGARIRYALLGATFTPIDEGETISIEVPVCDIAGDIITWALASNVDKVYTGLTGEFADAVFDGASRAEELLGGGCLLFAPAAHGEVGSSSNMFAIVAEAVVEMLKLDAYSMHEDTIVKIIGDAMQRRTR